MIDTASPSTAPDPSEVPTQPQEKETTADRDIIDGGRPSPDALARFAESDAPVTCYPVVEGLRATAPSTVLRELHMVARSSTVRELIRNAEIARARWQRFKIFSDVEFNLEPVADGRPEDVVARFYFTEKRALKQIGVTQAGDGTMPEMKATLHNAFGRAYEISCHVTPSVLKTLSYSMNLVSHTPFVGDRCEYAVSSSTEPHALHYGDQERILQAKVVVYFDEVVAMPGDAVASDKKNNNNSDTSAGGGTTTTTTTAASSTGASLGTPPPPPWRRTFTAGFQRRQLIPRDSTPTRDSDGPTAALVWSGIPAWLQSHFAPSTKAFVRWQLRYNDVQFLAAPWYDVFALPVGGTDAAASFELAGGLLGGGTSLARAEAQWTRHRSLYPFVVLDLNVRCGLAAGFGGSDWVGEDARWSDLRLSDRFYLNWRNVRGYLAVGPNTNTEAAARNDPDPPRRFRCLGGNFVWAASASLNFPFPLWPWNGLVSSHVFANVGNLALVDNLAHLASAAGDIFGRPKASVGAGLVAMQVPGLGPVPNGRLELNMALPVNVGAVFGGGAAGDGTAGVSSPWVFDKLRWGLHWTCI